MALFKSGQTKCIATLIMLLYFHEMEKYPVILSPAFDKL